MKKLRIYKLPILLYAAVFMCCACVSMVEKTGRVLDGSAFDEKKIAVYKTFSYKTFSYKAKKAGRKKKIAIVEVVEVQNKAGVHSLIITLADFPSVKLCGSMPDGQGIFHLTSLDYLGGNTNGWNEYRLDMFGTGSFIPDGQTAVLSVSGDIEGVQISAGRIHRFDTRITGNEALSSLRNRRERILSVAKWMNEREGSPANQSPDDFEKYWKPLLFPEMVSKKLRPANWQQKGDQWIRAESIRWNTGYTERTFPEFLREIRNSATLLRDWEEAMDWIHLEYEWKRITETLAKSITLQRIK
jgi:hypothetical protein